jgi:phosphatidylglycerophosphatase A
MSGRAAKILGKDDPSEVVIDEFAGTWVAEVLCFGALLLFFGQPFSLWQTFLIWLSALIFFRIFDIWKPWPISRLERLPDGLGIMADDVAAGVIGGMSAFFVCACVMSLLA